VANRLAKIVEESSGGRFRIDVFSTGQIMQPFECFDAASKGTVEAFMAVPSYWAAREPALEWFMTIPFGMNPDGMAYWYEEGDGLKLWAETYAPFNLVPRPVFSNAPQMGGWFRRKINTLGDFKGLKMRMAGLGGKVIARAGGTAILTPGSADRDAALAAFDADGCSAPRSWGNGPGDRYASHEHGYDKVIVPEMNLGQLALLLRAKYLVDVHSHTKVAGAPFRAEELQAVLTDTVKGVPA